MVFSSLLFLYVFLPLVAAVYFIAPSRLKNTVLLLFSLAFYWWGEPKYAVLMLITVSFCYVAGRIIEKKKETQWAKPLLIFSVAVPLGFLAVFKYGSFITRTLSDITGAELPLLELALPIGISFYTFQALSYLVDVYRGTTPAQKNLISLATYIALFPQLIAGPIVRYTHVARDLRERKHTLQGAYSGIMRFTVGLGKKVLIANTLGALCALYRESAEPSVVFSWMYAISYSLQLYFDFSAYSDMAIGLGRVFGFSFIENFNYPYISKSITEFWRRWHISLGSWFRDYVYIPLGGNRVSPKRHIFNILTVWALTGIWHGAGWTFMCWGLYFGILLIAEKLFLKKLLEKTPSPLRHAYVLIAVVFSFVIFNAETFTQVLSDLKAMTGLAGLPFISADTLYYLRSYALILILALIGATPIASRVGKRLRAARWSAVPEVLFIIAVLLLSTAYLVDGSFNPFLYFRF